ncbi:MAG: protein-export membrane protein SecF, partial [Acidobacteria bacterium 13_1_40CM_2_56_11]
MIEIFRDVKVNWLGKRKLYLAISGSIMLLGLVSLVVKHGFRYGVDFRGGTIVTVRFQQKPEIEKIRQLLRENGAPDSQPQELAGRNDVLIEFQGAKEEDASAGRSTIINALNKGFQGKFEVLSATSIGPKVGDDLKRQAVLATLYALGGMLIYIGFRFDSWIYGAAAVFAAFHDTLVTLGLFSIFNREINLTVIAALLTLVGYSMNDTIVVFDRIRENLKIRRRDALETVMNDSINQTLSRTILTSGLTFLTVVALFLFGGEIINHFAFAMVVGIIIGTYSSIAIAAPLVLVYTNIHGRAVAPVAAPVRAAAATKMMKGAKPAKVK